MSELGQKEIDAMLFRARRPGILLNKTKSPDDPGATGCWLGGEPTMPPEIDWPWYRETELGIETPMLLLAQIDLTQVPRFASLPSMPETGTLFFFHDPLYAPFYSYTAGSRVIYVDHDVSELPMRPAPPLPEPEEIVDDGARTLRRQIGTYRRWNVDFLIFEHFRHDLVPNRQLEDHALNANSKVIDSLQKITRPRHTGFGPDRAQGFAFHHMLGTCFEGNRYPDGELTRLLTIDMGGDQDIGFTGGERLVFWVPDDDLEAHNFDNALLLSE
ncbi:MAG: DUF1963 domain-containing protein [Pseudomonadota bacterium]